MESRSSANAQQLSHYAPTTGGDLGGRARIDTNRQRSLRLPFGTTMEPEQGCQVRVHG